MLEWANCVWAAPVAASILEVVLGKVKPRARGAAAAAACAIAATASLALLASGARGVVRWRWVNLPGLGCVEFGLLVDQLSAVLAAVVASVSLAVFVYSLGYMRGDPGLTRYWAVMSLFVGGMELLVLSENLLVMLVGWEVVGVCSFALISYWYEDREEDRATRWVGEPPEEYPPSHCGVKAFLVTRFADTLMVAGVLALVVISGTSSLAKLAERAPPASSELLTAVLLLIYAGALGKSAQLPFMEWLPDAMAGPSSVSALIHAATMVKAGVYLTARLAQLALSWGAGLSPFFTLVSACGLATAVAAGLQAAVTGELKKTLAYSTASQIGYMMAALGAAQWAREAAIAAAVYHLVSHALFKSSLFLAAGVLIHATETRFYRGMRGAGRQLRLTTLALLLATASLVGIPPFAGFWSKEAVLSVLLARPAFLAPALAASCITAFYSARMLLLLLTGGPPELKRGSSPIEDVPYLALAASGLVLGLLAPAVPSLLPAALEGGLPGASEACLSLAAVAVGFAAALAVYARGLRSDRLEPLLSVLRRRLYLNAAYYRLAAWAAKLADRVRALEGVYASVLRRAAAVVSAESEELAKVQTGALGLRELAWAAGALVLLLLLLAAR